MREAKSYITELEGKVRLLEYEVTSLKTHKAADNAENNRLHDYFEARLADKEREIQFLLDQIFEPGLTLQELKSALAYLHAQRTQREASHAA